MKDPRISYLRTEILNRHADSLRKIQSIPEGAIEAVIETSPFEITAEERIKFVRHFQSIFAITQGQGLPFLQNMSPGFTSDRGTSISTTGID